MMAIIQDPRTDVFAYKTLPTLHRRLVNKVSFMVRVQRDSNPRPATPQAAILSKLNYGPHPRVNLSIYEFPLILIFHLDRKSTRLNSSHMSISYAVFCLK